MINIIINIIIGSEVNEKNLKQRDKSIKKSGVIGLFLNLLLFAVKLVIGIIINSVAVISDAFNNLADSMSSVVTLIGTYLAEKPADEEHPYGHGRFEYISSLVVAFLILVTGLTLLKESVVKIFNPEDLNFSVITTSILIISIIVKIFIYRYNKVLGEKINSITLIGVAKDALSDILSTIGIIISILIYYYFDINLDGFIGVVVSFIVLKSGYDIAMDSIDVILGKAPDKELINKIEDILKSGKYVEGVHRLNIYEYGRGNIYGSVHLDFPCSLYFRDVHETADELENRIYDECKVKIAIHMDPVNCLERENDENGNCKNRNNCKYRSLRYK
ncbi:cation diffusion facilitator family transporter [Miniphocaeibacter massiliensis]|uniref:cation diffusion facilitator family transporter n=1 Tax=Miniphocaeibacter massiliensis TaxID=2041841 RepID=UPI0013EC1121|nr:cation diffusion facilitator family transporter [Miniphocaeibacter massiliensis]